MVRRHRSGASRARQCLGHSAAAILFGALATSGATIQLFSDVPIEIVNILQGLVMIFAVVRFSNLWKGRRA